MRSLVRTALFLALALIAVATPPLAADVEIRTIERAFSIDDDQEIVLDIPLGELLVTTGEPGKVVIEVVVKCSSSSRRCRERAGEIYLDDSLRRRSLNLEIGGYSNKLTSRPSVEIHLTMPAGSGLEVDMGVGEIEIEGLDGDVEVDLGVGEVRLLTRQEQVGSLRLAVGVGSADIRPRPRRQSSSGFLFFGNEIFWNEGEGTGSYVVDVGVGEVEVRLDG
jgi:hypothetical protein